MKKHYTRMLLLAIMLMAGSNLWASPVDASRALTVAKNFLQNHGGKNAQSLQLVASPTPHEFYLFAAEGGGFVMVAADDAVLPIIGYSTTSTATFEAMPAHVASRLELYDEGIRQGKLHPSNTAANQWRLLEIGERLTATHGSPVGPLMTTTWNQSPYYNALCPYDSEYEELTVTGCVATATAQIMKYWNHPATGYGSHSYEADNGRISYGTLTADFGNTTYQWTQMPNELTAASSDAQVQAVATLMYHVGVADEMNYDVSAKGGSGAQNYSYTGSSTLACSQNSLINYFKYSPKMGAASRDEMGDELFCQSMYNELAANRPILFSGSSASAGHSFVIDGFDADGLFHVNWGWGGYCDGYFQMGALNPSGAGIGASTENTYNLNDVALMGIQPNTSWGDQTTVSVSTTLSGATVSGAGTYSFGDEISLSANAPEGYVFSHWSDYSTFTDRSFTATGGNLSFVANFKSLSGDTLSYCGNKRWRTSFSSSSWAIRLPSSVLTDGKPMWGVQFHPVYSGNYSWSIQSGSTEPTTTVASGTVNVSEDETRSWYTLRFDEPATIDATQNLWIIFTYDDYFEDGCYPAALTYFCGNADGMVDGNGFFSYTTEYGWRYTYMLRGLFGTEPEVVNECILTDFPYTMDFEQGAPCWEVEDNDGDNRKWNIYNGYGVNESRAAGVVWGEESDDWIITPIIKTPGIYRISWAARAMDVNYPEAYHVVALGNENNVIYTNEYVANDEFQTYTADFTVAHDEEMRIGFNYLAINESRWAFFIDDVTIEQLSVAAPAPHVDVTVNTVTPATGSASFTATPNSGCTSYEYFVTDKGLVDYYVASQLDQYDYDLLLEFYATHTQLVVATGNYTTGSTISVSNLPEGTTYGIYIRATGADETVFYEATSFLMPYTSGGTGVATASISYSNVTATSVDFTLTFGSQTAYYRYQGSYGQQDLDAVAEAINEQDAIYNRGISSTSLNFTGLTENATIYLYIMPYNQNGEPGELAWTSVQLQAPSSLEPASMTLSNIQEHSVDMSIQKNDASEYYFYVMPAETFRRWVAQYNPGDTIQEIVEDAYYYTDYTGAIKTADFDTTWTGLNAGTEYVACMAICMDNDTTASWQFFTTPGTMPSVSLGNIHQDGNCIEFTATLGGNADGYTVYLIDSALYSQYYSYYYNGFISYSQLMEYSEAGTYQGSSNGSGSICNLTPLKTYWVVAYAWNTADTSNAAQFASLTLHYTEGGTGTATATLAYSNVTATSVDFSLTFGDQTAFYRFMGYFSQQNLDTVAISLNGQDPVNNKSISETSIPYTDLEENATFYLYVMPYNQNGDPGELAWTSVQLQDPTLATHTITINNPDGGYIYYCVRDGETNDAIQCNRAQQGTTTVEYTEGQRFCIDFGDINPNKQSNLGVSNYMVASVSADGESLALDADHFTINDQWEANGYRLYTLCGMPTADVVFDATFSDYDYSQDIASATLTVRNHGGGYLAIVRNGSQARIYDSTYYTYSAGDTALFTFGTFAPGFDWTNIVADTAARLERMLLDGVEVDFTDATTPGISIYNHTDEGYSFYNYQYIQDANAHTLEFFFTSYEDATTCESASMPTLTELSNTTATVQWMPSPSADYYTLSLGGLTTTTTNASYTFTELTASTTYTLTITTHCLNGGEESITLNFTTQGDPVPASMTLSNIQERSVDMSIQKNDASEYYFYVMPAATFRNWVAQYNPGDTVQEVIEDAIQYNYGKRKTADFDTTWTGLNPGTEYVACAAICTGNDTTASWQFFTTPGTMPALELTSTATTESSITAQVQANEVTTSYVVIAISYDTLLHYYQAYNGQASVAQIVANFYEAIATGNTATATLTLGDLLPSTEYWLYYQAYGQQDTTGILQLGTCTTQEAGVQPVAVGVTATVDAVDNHSVTLSTAMTSATTDYYLCIYPKGQVEQWMTEYSTTLTEELVEDLLHPYLPNVQHYTTSLSAQQFTSLTTGSEYGVYILACSATDTVGSVEYFTTTGTMPNIDLTNATATSSSLSFSITGNSVTTGYVLVPINYDTLNHYYQVYSNEIQSGQYNLVDIIVAFRDTLINSAAGSGSHTVSNLLPDAPYYIYAQAYSQDDTTNVFLLDSLHTAPYVAPTTYTLTVLSANNTMGSTTGSGTYTEDSTVQIEAIAATGYHFTAWNDGNTDNPRTVTVTANATYIASFEADGTTGIEGADDIAFTLYPNPATTKVTLTFEEAEAEVEVRDMTGRVAIERQTLSGSQHTLDVSRLAAGTYFISLNMGGHTAVRKLVVK